MKRTFLWPGLIAAAGLAGAQGISTEAWYAVPDARGVQLINVTCGADFIDPREIVVDPGLPVELSVRSAEPTEEFVSGFGANMPIGRQARKAGFTPTTRGPHPISCKKQGVAQNDDHPRKRGILHVGNPHKKP